MVSAFLLWTTNSGSETSRSGEDYSWPGEMKRPPTSVPSWIEIPRARYDLWCVYIMPGLATVLPGVDFSKFMQLASFFSRHTHNTCISVCALAPTAREVDGCQRILAAARLFLWLSQPPYVRSLATLTCTAEVCAKLPKWIMYCRLHVAMLS